MSVKEFVEIFHDDWTTFKTTSRFVTVGFGFSQVLKTLGVAVPEDLSSAAVTGISGKLGFSCTHKSWQEFTEWVQTKKHYVVLGSISMTGRPQVMVVMPYDACLLLEPFDLLTSTATAYVAPPSNDFAPKIQIARRDEDAENKVRGRRTAKSFPVLFKDFTKL